MKIVSLNELSAQNHDYHAVYLGRQIGMMQIKKRVFGRSGGSGRGIAASG